MKLHLGFLSFCLLLAVILLSSPLRAAFKIDVHINGAENPTLSFGEAGARTRAPHPPFSGMFGVADVCFAGPADAPQWFDRLAEDVKVTAGDNTWVLVAKSNARLTFKKKDGDIPANGLKIVYNDPKSPEETKTVALADNLAFSVKTGGVYTITRSGNPDIPAPDPNADNNQFVPKDGSGEVAIAPPDGLQKIKISFVAPQGVVAYLGEDVTQRVPPIAEEDVDWWISVSRPGYTVGYLWTTPYTELEVTLTSEGPTRVDADLNVSMTPTRSATPVTTMLDFLDDQDTLKLTKTIDWILQKFGTLDFDGDGEITISDVMYFYNFKNANMPAFSTNTVIENNNIKKLLQYILKDFSNPTAEDFEKAKTAIGVLREDTDSLKFDGVEEVNIDHVMYFYNFKNANMPAFSTNTTIENNNIKKLLQYILKNYTNPSLEDFDKAKTAMETLREYKDNL